MFDNWIFDKPPELILQYFTNEIKGISSRIDTNLHLLSRYERSDEESKQYIHNMQLLLAAMNSSILKAEEYIASRGKAS